MTNIDLTKGFYVGEREIQPLLGPVIGPSVDNSIAASVMVHYLMRARWNFQIRSIPTLILFKNGRAVARRSVNS